ncbi:MAG: hypothetical protein ACXWU2_04880 [Allosphingosinicella sp.]
MHFSKSLLSAALAVSAVAALAQDPPAPDAEPKAEESRGLQDLEATVDELIEQEGEPTVPERGTPRLEETRPLEVEQVEPQPRRESEPAEPESEPTEPAPAETAPAEAAEAEPETGTPPAAPPPSRPMLLMPLTPEQLTTLDRNAERGRLLITIARAGIIATEDMLSRVSDPAGAGIAGWIAEPEGNGVGVTFYAESEDGPRAVYRASVNGGRVVERNIYLAQDRPTLNPIEARMAAARAATEGLDHEACGGAPFNVLVVPPTSAGAPVTVYQTSPPTRPGHFPLGGHFRTIVAADGTIAETRGFTNSCLDVAAPAMPAGVPARPIGVTHLLDPLPTEIHVFLSQMMGRPLLVAAGEPTRVWLVTPERIAEVRP